MLVKQELAHIHKMTLGLISFDITRAYTLYHKSLYLGRSKKTRFNLQIIYSRGQSMFPKITDYHSFKLIVLAVKRPKPCILCGTWTDNLS